jgi:hypothetical protein
MKFKIGAVLWILILILTETSYAADEQAPLETKTMPSSLGGQAGEVARELKDTAGESLSAGAAKVAESSRKLEAEAQDASKILQQQWEAFAKQLQEKTQQLQKQLQAQWQDFNKSFNQPSKS